MCAKSTSFIIGGKGIDPKPIAADDKLVILFNFLLLTLLPLWYGLNTSSNRINSCDFVHYGIGYINSFRKYHFNFNINSLQYQSIIVAILRLKYTFDNLCVMNMEFAET